MSRVAGALANVAAELGTQNGKIDAVEKQILDAQMKLTEAESSDWPAEKVERLSNREKALLDVLQQLHREKELLLLERSALLQRVPTAPGAPPL